MTEGGQGPELRDIQLGSQDIDAAGALPLSNQTENTESAQPAINAKDSTTTVVNPNENTDRENSAAAAQTTEVASTPTATPDREIAAPAPEKNVYLKMLDIPLVVITDKGVSLEAAKNLLQQGITENARDDAPQDANTNKKIVKEAWEVFVHVRQMHAAQVSEENPDIKEEDVLHAIDSATQVTRAIAASYEASLNAKKNAQNPDGTVKERKGIALRDLKGGIDPTSEYDADEAKKSGELTGGDILKMVEPETVTSAAEQLHTAYKGYHKDEAEIQSVLREYVTKEQTQDGENRTTTAIIDLLAADFQNLPEHWKQVNETSARNILVILRVMLPDDAFNCIFAQNSEKDDDSSPKIDISTIITDENLIFNINSALYSIWSKRPETTQGKKNNPLFHCNSYDEFSRISKGDEPDDGWEKFIESYRVFLDDNKETYAPNSFKSTQSKSEGVTASSPKNPNVLYADLPRDIAKIDENIDGVINSEEVEKFSEDYIKLMIKAQAISELEKDKSMMVRFLSGMYASNQKARASN